MLNFTESETELLQTLASAKPNLTPNTHAQLLQYLLLLNKWNRAYNLTSVRVLAEMVPVHILDSLAIADYLIGQQILDVGTGAGLPGIPLAIVQPHRQFLLLDSNGKKTRFLTHVVQQLNLANVTIVQARVETYKPALLFDTIISRAFSSLQDFLLKTQHVCATAGQFLAMKGQYPQDELAALPANFKLVESHALQIAGLAAQRHLICLSKN